MGKADEPVSKSESCYIAEIYYWAALVSVVLTALLVIIGLCRKVVILRRKYKADGLYLQVVTDHTWENIRIGEACVPSEQLFMSYPQQPLIVAISLLLGCRNCEAWITWGRKLQASNVSVKREARPVALPRSVTISNQLAHDLDSERGYIRLARLVRQIGGLTSIIPMATPMINGDGWSTIGEEIRVAETSLRQNKKVRVAKGKKGCKGTGKSSRTLPRPL